MTPARLLELLFNPPEVFGPGNLAQFLKSVGPGAPATPSGFERLVQVALRADHRVRAGAAGHQAAIRRLFPQTPDDAVVAFCVSEEKGPRPSHIFTTLTPAGSGFVLNGVKRWGSMSPVSDVLYVAASIGQKDGRNQLRMVRTPTGRNGLDFDTTPYATHQGHMPIADITLSNVAVGADDVLPDDAYEAYIKPFRLVEDVYNTAATQIGLLRLGRAYSWPQDVLEDLVGLIVQAQAISETPMARPEDVLLMSAYFRASDGLWRRLANCWARVPEEERALWSPQIGTLGVAARARDTRRENAWAELTPTVPPQN